jgi:hypothetical protein
MITAIRAQQDTSGLWATSLLDHAQFPDMEVSGSAFFGFAMCWGMRYGLLDTASWLPVVRKDWNGCVANVQSTGRLGRCQWMGSQPATINPDTTTLEGNGAFLLFGNELLQLLNTVQTRRFSPEASRLAACSVRLAPQSIVITLPGAAKVKYRVSLYDNNGRRVAPLSFSTTASGGTTIVSIDRTRLAKGSYAVEILSGHTSVARSSIAVR